MWNGEDLPVMIPNHLGSAVAGKGDLAVYIDVTLMI
jgi:hypothetical protein